MTNISGDDVVRSMNARHIAECELGMVLRRALDELSKVPFKEFAKGADFSDMRGGTATATYVVGKNWRVMLNDGQWATITYGHPNILLKAGKNERDDRMRNDLLDVPVSTVTMLTIRAALDALLTGLHERVPQTQRWLSDAVEASGMTKSR